MVKQYDIIIVGAGPAGIFAALELVKAKAGLKILIVEKGREIEKRVCVARERNAACFKCQPCSTVCGWGGAGAFSDGKLTLSTEVGGNLGLYTGEKNLADLIDYIDREYLHFGAPEQVFGMEHEEEIQEMQRRAVLSELKLLPVRIRHMGTGRTSEILQRMQEFLVARGVDVLTSCQVEEVLVKDQVAQGIVTQEGKVYHANCVILAPGREGADWLKRVAQQLGLKMSVNPVDIGVRVELPAAVMEHLTRIFYEVKLLYYSKTFSDRVRTFCMNPNGEVVLENNDGLVTVNGHSHAFNKTENTNFAVLVSKNFTQPFKEPIAYGRYISSLANLLGGGVIIQSLGDLVAGRRSTKDRLAKCMTMPTLAEATPGDLSLVFPYRHLMGIVEMLKALNQIAPGVYSRYTLLYGVEVKFYSSRLALSNCLETEVKNLFAAGDGAGITRGLAQASAAGVLAAREIINRI
ncbi:NAD(P)/FAD-dependent oxidoreductase [Pelotomaculum isophthalicicum JI]|uniref:NAD(P)/FAD-dependent oxidoreductase n=1 Tax=Pelotomaculum isophthalicicum JI TaxID=947010 RepID=A0A9X4H459_9FIRM|nr:NAD(P)/FAD-dependent oxidoreductase [Pelotomaculum isophthalicicum]MDF9407043.1 NAD(P)/FAD-dependent oxidoreductase [Pelotomaculum isophthalicicum JI]